jgi:hypothetical protein
MHARTLFLPFASLLLAAVLPAQYVSSAHFTAAEGTSNNVYPFGSTATSFRYLQIHDDVPAMVITGLKFRHDSSSSGTVRPAYTLTLDAWISTATVASASASTTFDTNHGLDKIQCVTNRTISVPANDPSKLPGDFLLDIPFDPSVVFPFAGNPASVCWEVQVTAHTNGSIVPYDSVGSSTTTAANPPLAATRGGVGCLATGQTQTMLVAPTATAMNWPSGTGNLTVNGTRLEPNGLIVWVNGIDRTQWNGIPLPVVVPTSTGAPSGTCTLYTDLFFLTVATASGTGTATLTLPLTVTPALHGFVVYTQVLGVDAAANPFGFTLSNVAAQQLVAPHAMPQPSRRVYLQASLGPTGNSDAVYLITQFY